MRKKLYFLSLLGSFCAPAFAEEARIQEVSFNIGMHTEFYSNIQYNTSGGVRKFDTDLTIGAGIQYKLNQNWSFLPEINWVLPQDVGSRIIENRLMFRGDLGYDLLSWLRLRIGSSLMWLNQHGRGGEVEINNGNSTSTFYYPDENRSSLNNTFDLGVECLFHEDWSARMQTYTYSLFRKERRQISYTLFLTYHWKQ